MPAHIITPDLLAQVGRALYGARWHTALARDLGISSRMIRFMLAGERGIHAGIVRDLVTIVEARGVEIGEVAPELRRALGLTIS